MGGARGSVPRHEPQAETCQWLPLNTIIIAIIVLVVLVVIVAIFTGRIEKFETSLSSEEQQAKVQAEALRSDGTLAAGADCPTTPPPGKCVASGSCPYDHLQSEPAGAVNWCMQGLVCCKPS